jgi:hypothetical protein
MKGTIMKRINLVKAVLPAVAETLHRGLFNYMQRAGLILEAAHAAPASFTDTIYAVCATLPASYDAAGYAASGLTYTTIGQVESFPEFGSERTVNEFKPINGAVTKSKGAPNYGGGPMVMADIPADAGQVILKAAEASANHYSMKLTYPDGEIHYLDVLVCSWRLAQAGEGGWMKRTAAIQLCKAPVVVAAV